MKTQWDVGAVILLCTAVQLCATGHWFAGAVLVVALVIL